MSKMIAYCGLACDECEGFLATRNNDQALREKIAAQWSKEFNHEIKPEDVNCTGCLSTEGPVLNYCQVCEIRACGRSRALPNCARCPDYACEKLTKFLAAAPAARQNLEEIRKNS
jgi:hypothetical protein